jgi:hypothetical protein
MIPSYIYAGPSWAAFSYPISEDSTNLSKEWKIKNISVAKGGSSVLEQLDLIKSKLIQQSLPIIWIYNEPLADLKKITGITMEEFVQREDWQLIMQQCSEFCFDQIDALGVPVLLIGGARDIQNCERKNITIGHASWQKWLAKQSGMNVIDNIIKVTPFDGGNYDLAQCWGAELVHQFLHSRTDINPNNRLLDAIWDIYYFWEELQRRDWFFEVHPNKRGNVEFANFLKPTVDKFLEENSNG